MSACSWSADSKSQEVLIRHDSVCEFSLGQSEGSLQGSFDKISVYNEQGESYKFRGKICNDSVLADIEVVDKAISKISIIDSTFCSEGICIGTFFGEVRALLPDSKFYFSGEEGGLFALEDSNGVSYVFSTKGIDIACYITPDKCKNEIGNAKLIALVI